MYVYVCIYIYIYCTYIILTLKNIGILKTLLITKFTITFNSLNNVKLTLAAIIP